MDSIALGDTVKDSITGFEGVAISRHDYLGGWIRFSVQPKLIEGKFQDAQTFDEGLLQLVSKAAK